MAKLLDLERELAGVSSLRDLSGTILDSIAQLTGATGSTLFSFDQMGSVSTQGGSLESAMTDYTPDLFAEDALQQWSLGSPPNLFLSNAVHPDGKKFNLPRHVRSRPYTDFYRPLDIAFVLGVWPTRLAYGSPQMFGLLLTKPHPFRPFDADAMATLYYLEVPLRLAARRIEQFRSIEQKADVLAHLSERQPGSYALWDIEGRLVWVSAKAQRQLESKLRRSDLERAAQLALLQLRSRRRSGEAMLGRPRHLRSSGGPPMIVSFSWIADSDRRPWLLAEIEDGSSARSPLRLLTAAESRVLRLLSQGLSNKEIAVQLRISSETVKTHVKHVLTKLQVSSRAKAARIAQEARLSNLVK